ncbi:MAG: hypothetical protein ACKOET_01555 [Verrucomicrobiota bacterium]
MGLVLGSTFIIAAERSAIRGSTALVEGLFADRSQEIFPATWAVVGELAGGPSAPPREDGHRLGCPYPVLPWTPGVSWKHGEPCRTLAVRGPRTGTHDRWIAAPAWVHPMGIITRDAEASGRWPGLTVVPC